MKEIYKFITKSVYQQYTLSITDKFYNLIIFPKRNIQEKERNHQSI